MYCKYCGQQIAPESAVCPYCRGQLRSVQPNPQQRGTQQPYPNQPQRPAQPQQPASGGSKGHSNVVRRKKTVVWVLCIIWLVVLLLLAALIFTKCSAEDKTKEEPVAEEPEEPAEPTDPEEPGETVPAKDITTPEIDPDLPLVSDAFYDDSHRKNAGGIFAIPQINLPGDEIAAINDEIYTMHYLGFAKDALTSMDEYDERGVIYDWAKNGDVLSLVIEAHLEPFLYEGWTEFDVYNISISECRLMSDEEVIALSPVQNYSKNVKEAMETRIWETYSATSIANDKSSVQTFNQVLEKTRSSENIDLAVPYFDYRGDLCAICYIYSMAEAEGYYQRVNLENYSYKSSYAGTLTYVPKETEKPKQNSPTVQAPSSEFIIPGSDSRIITRDDLEGLTEHETWLALDELYARHGRLFGDGEIADYFNSLSWYNGHIDGKTFDKNLDKYMNAVEKANIDIIADYQREMGWRN